MSHLDQNLVEVLLAIAIGFSSLTFYFIRQTIQKLADQMLDQRANLDKLRDEFTDSTKTLEIEIAIIKRDLDHLSNKE